MFEKDIFQDCKKKGLLFNTQDIDILKIKSILKNAETDFRTANFLLENKKESVSSIYKLYYDALHEITTAFILFDKIKSYNHQCLFAFLCNKYRFDLNIFEKIRIKRNRISYYGEILSSSEFNFLINCIQHNYKKLHAKIEKKLSIR